MPLVIHQYHPLVELLAEQISINVHGPTAQHCKWLESCTLECSQYKL